MEAKAQGCTHYLSVWGSEGFQEGPQLDLDYAVRHEPIEWLIKIFQVWSVCFSKFSIVQKMNKIALIIILLKLVFI